MASQRKQVTGEASHPGDYAVVYLVLCFALRDTDSHLIESML